MTLRLCAILAILFPALAFAQADPPQQAPTKPGEYIFKYVARIDGKPVQMAYALVLPKGYDTETSRKFPMIVFTHGAGETGTDGQATFNNGPGMELRRGNPFKESFPFIFLAPQCPPRGERWDQPQMYKAVSQIVDAAIKSVRVDVDRVYLTGLSMGGKGCWLAALEGADRFAAIAPMCAGTTHPEAAEKLKYVAIWMISGTNDGDAVNHNNEMLGVLKNNVAEVRNTIVPGADHMVWPPFYASPQFYEWMLAHKRPNAAERREMDAAGPYLSRKQVFPKTPGFHRVNIPIEITGQPLPLICSVFIPKTYSPTGAPAPAMLFMHEYNSISMAYKNIPQHGPITELAKKGNELFQASFPMVVISPQLPVGMGDWSQKPVRDGVLHALEEITKSMNLDMQRLYATGLNEGAAAAWQIAVDAPTMFAGVMPIVVNGGVISPNNIDAGKDLPTWLIAPDPGSFKGMFDGKTAWKVTAAPKLEGENQSSVYKNKDLYDWLLARKKGQ